MASYDQLSAQQRAIVDLVLKRGQSYDQLADTLGMPVDRVRGLAHETLTSLAPVSAAAVDEGWRAQIADYLLNQQSPPEAAATRGHLRRSEAARAWSSSVLDSLEHLYANGDMPTIPAGDNGGGQRAPRAERSRPERTRDLSPEAAAVVRRRRIIGGAAIGALLLFVLLIWPVGLVTGGDDSSGDDKAASSKVKLLGQVLLKPVATSGPDAADAGIAIVTSQNGKLELSLQARLQRSPKGEAYEVWLYNSPQDAKSLGAQVTDAKGNFAGRTSLPANYRDYKAIDISREPVDRNADHSGQSVLRANTSAIKPPRGNAGTATTPSR